MATETVQKKKKKKEKHYKHGGYMPQRPGGSSGGENKTPFLHDCDEKHHNHTRYFTCTSYGNTSVHVISRERKEWRSIIQI